MFITYVKATSLTFYEHFLITLKKILYCTSRANKIIKKVEPSDIMMCDKCGKVFPSKLHLQKHKWVHYERNFKCEFCERTYRRASDVKQHQVLFHDHGRPFTCNLCSKSYKLNSLLTYHMRRTHTNEMIINSDDASYQNTNFTCNICQKSFVYERDLRQHVKRTHDRTDDKCMVCGKRVRNNMDAHLTMHEGTAGRFVCDVCGTMLKSRSGFVAHMRKHRGVRPYVCEVCGKTFTDQKYLVAHSRTHTNDRPFSCQICQKGFTQQTTLTIHVRSHTGERPYTCDICCKHFRSRSAMNSHKCLSK